MLQALVLVQTPRRATRRAPRPRPSKPGRPRRRGLPTGGGRSCFEVARELWCYRPKVQGSTAHSGVRVSSGAREGGGCTKGCTERLERRPRGGGAISLAATWLGAQWRRCESCLEQLSFCVNTIVYHARPWLCVWAAVGLLCFFALAIWEALFFNRSEARRSHHTDTPCACAWTRTPRPTRAGVAASPHICSVQSIK